MRRESVAWFSGLLEIKLKETFDDTRKACKLVDNGNWDERKGYLVGGLLFWVPTSSFSIFIVRSMSVMICLSTFRW